ncbi:signal transduction histidine kinase, putative [Heliomicrobium modesticaldum Ice1]|uniref:histidine kinase n=1 Tax=Heliobacterium modesticaldum (strain ATCC 51547 / Ice1) TaxID=498761 RepID=B0TB12_HELMI|nr:PAS domain S-box protein [Heliomicrobium modesticaldum]ABZ85123.1 signal transduction histidine kinase, putative [Heliomicrobium modesticaldum Ice1]
MHPDLSKEQDDYRLIFEHAAVGLCLNDLEGKCLKANKAFCSIVGYSEQELLHMRFQDFSHPDDVETEGEYLRRLHSGELDGYTLEKRYINRSRLIWVQLTIVPIKDQYGRLVYTLAQVQDITEEKRIEAELHSQTELLREERDSAENQIRQFFSLSVDLMCVVGMDGYYKQINSAFSHVLGYSEEELMATPYLSLIHEDDQIKVKALNWEQFKSQPLRDLEVRHRCKDGSYRWISWTSVVNLQTGLIYGVGRDVTVQKQLEQELLSIDRLNIIARMAAGLGHEIRNPMTTVRGFLQIMSKMDENEERRRYFELMISELDRANAIITEFLSFTRRKSKDPQPSNLKRLVEDFFPLLQADALREDKWIQLELADVPDLILDEKEIRQLLFNLVRNGLEAMAPGKCVTIRTAVDDDVVVLQIEDQGSGISDKDMKNLGVPFFTTKDKGTGLGLPIAYNIASRHKAKITVESSSKGSCFSVHFPIGYSVPARRE